MKDSGRGVSLSKFGVWDVIMSLRAGHLQLERLRSTNEAKVSAYED